MERLLNIRLRASVLSKAAVVYIALPLLIFAVSWLRPGVGAAATISLVIALFACLRRSRRSGVAFPSPYESSMRRLGSSGGGVVRIGPLALFTLALVVIVWCVLGGQGGLWYQSADWNSRNALFRDLMTHRWPCVYQSDGSYLCYYVAHWLPSALVGKTLLRVGLSLEIAWAVASVALLCWTALGMTLLLLMVAATVGARTRPQLALCALATVFFSGTDVVGCALAGTGGPAMEAMHLEWWAVELQIAEQAFVTLNNVIVRGIGVRAREMLFSTFA